MAEILFHYPLHRLLNRIVSQNIDGDWFIESVISAYEDLIAEETGWNEDDVYQIQSVLFRHHSCTQSQFEENMSRQLSNMISQLRLKIDDSLEVADRIKKVTSFKDIADRIKGVMSRHNIEET
eukprot:900787_1